MNDYDNIIKAIIDGSNPVFTKSKRKPRSTSKVGRNDPCPCGSGKKYKACHGKDAA